MATVRKQIAPIIRKDFEIHVRDRNPQSEPFVKRISDSINNVVDKATQVPERIRQVADRADEAVMQITNRSKRTAEKNLKQSAITGMFSRFGRWVQQGNNMWYVIGGVVIAIILLRGTK